MMAGGCLAARIWRDMAGGVTGRQVLLTGIRISIPFDPLSLGATASGGDSGRGNRPADWLGGPRRDAAARLPRRGHVGGTELEASPRR